MRFACYGFVEKDAGSVATASFYVLDELLRRGHEVDFYTTEGFVYPTELFVYENCRYEAIPTAGERRFRRVIPATLEKVLDPFIGQFYHYRHLDQIGERIRIQHNTRSYDLVLFLGLAAPFKVADLPIISWLQGPPQTEWDAIRRNRRLIYDYCGRSLYLKLKTYYRYRIWLARRELPLSNLIICGSEWSKSALVAFGIPPEKAIPLPYPVDLDLFRPRRAASHPAASRKTLLWLGRIDPRKRLDLMLDAFRMIARERDDVDLKIIGRFSYAGGLRRLIDEFEYPDRINYTESIPRHTVPHLLQEVRALVQPSENENFGSSVAEAAACGIPSITGPTNGTADYLSACAEVFNTYSVADLHGSIQSILERSGDDRALESDRLAEVARANFQVKSIVDRLEVLLENCIRNS